MPNSVDEMLDCIESQVHLCFLRFFGKYTLRLREGSMHVGYCVFKIGKATYSV